MALAQSQAAASGARPTGATAKATFAGGCSWCVKADFDKLAGVVSPTSGYTGGRVVNPSLQQVSSKATGHDEAVEVAFGPVRYRFYRNGCGRDARLEQLWG